MSDKKTNLLNTSQRIFHVFACSGKELHVTSGFALLASGKGSVCPKCGAAVEDITHTPLGKAYFAFARPDLGVQQQSPKGML